MPLVWCLVIFAAIVVPWFVLAEARNPGFMHFFIVHEHLERYVASSEHGWGPWFFIPIVIGGTWPWIFFVPLGWSAMRAGDGLPDSARDPSGRRAAARFLAIWFIVIFVFFSIPRSKLGSYILPALPPLGDRCGIRPRTHARARRREPPPSSRRRCYREPGNRGSSFRIFRTRTGADKSRAWRRRIADWRRCGRRRDCDVLARARIVARCVRDRCDRAGDARGGAAGRARARGCGVDLHLSQPGKGGSALPCGRLYACLIPPLRPIAPVLYAPARDPGRVLGRAFGSFSRDRRASRRSLSAPMRACARSGRRARAWF